MIFTIYAPLVFVPINALLSLSMVMQLIVLFIASSLSIFKIGIAVVVFCYTLKHPLFVIIKMLLALSILISVTVPCMPLIASNLFSIFTIIDV